MRYPWYEMIECSDDITQGDILFDCPIPTISVPSSWSDVTNISAEIRYVDGIIMTQACDIKNNKVTDIVICAFSSRSVFEKTIGRKPDYNSIKNGRQPSLYILNEYKNELYSQDYCIVDFRSVFTLPIQVIKAIARNTDKRLRLCPPYRDHLSQAFGKYFMRVGLPIDIELK